jgi:hypothetical protein
MSLKFEMEGVGFVEICSLLNWQEFCSLVDFTGLVARLSGLKTTDVYVIFLSSSPTNSRQDFRNVRVIRME